jgi:hypothetical protein
VTESDALQTVEATLNVRLPKNYTGWLTENEGLEDVFGDCYLRLFAAHELLQANQDYGVAESLPGFVMIGTDGGGEAVVLDCRGGDRTVALVNLISLDLDDVAPQAESFGEFMDQRREGLPWRWGPD